MYDSENAVRKYRLKRIMLFFTMVEIAFCLFMIINAISAKFYNKKSIELSKLHMQYTEIAAELNKGSDVLTEQVRMFAQTGGIKYLEKYFEEANTVKHREKAMKALEEISATDGAIDQMKSSMNYSLKLMNTEYYAMKLTAKAFNIPESELPAEVINVPLSEEDDKLDSSELKDKARMLLFSDNYMQMKKCISFGTNQFLNIMIENSKTEYLALTKKVTVFSDGLELIIILVSTIILLMNLFQYKYVIRPIVNASSNISHGDRIDMPKFLVEMDSLGNSYNKLLLRNGKLVRQLRALAETDALTKLGNRTAYNYFSNQLHSEGGEAILFVFDVNDLREINNTKGHDEGDELLRTSAECIVNIFDKGERKNCFRIGGDEFVAFICGEPEENAELYIEKFSEEQKKYNIRIAVGYTYEKNMSEISIHDMFSMADRMMYVEKAKIKMMNS